MTLLQFHLTGCGRRHLRRHWTDFGRLFTGRLSGVDSGWFYRRHRGCVAGSPAGAARNIDSVQIGGETFPIVWSIAGSALLALGIGLLSGVALALVSG